MQTEQSRHDLAEQIRRLEASRQQHVAAVAQIDQLLGRIGDALQSLQAGAAQVASDAAASGPPELAESGNRPRHYHKSRMTGEHAVLAFVRRRGHATTAEINRQWRTEGRGGVANNAILRLLRRGELLREPIPGHRGSRYQLPASHRPASRAAEPSTAAADGRLQPPVADSQLTGSDIVG